MEKLAELEIEPLVAGVWVNKIVKLELYEPGVTPPNTPGVQSPRT